MGTSRHVLPHRLSTVALVAVFLLSAGVGRAETTLAPPYDSALTASSCAPFDSGGCSQTAEADAATGEAELRASQTAPGGGSIPGVGGSVASAEFRITHSLAEAQPGVVYSATLSIQEAKATVSGSTTGSRLAQTTARLSAFHLGCPTCSKVGDPVTLAIHTGPTEVSNEQVVISLALNVPENGQVPAGDIVIVVRLEAFASSGGSADTGASLAKFEGAVASVAVS